MKSAINDPAAMRAAAARCDAQGRHADADLWRECAAEMERRRGEPMRGIADDHDAAQIGDRVALVATLAIIAWLALDTLTELLAEYGAAIAKFLL